MNAFAQTQYELALDGLDRAIEMLDGSMEMATRNDLLRVRGQFVAMKQLLDLQEQLAEADTERPRLRVVP